MMRLPAVVVVAFFAWVAPSYSQDRDRWAIAEGEIVRLPPSAFPALPSALQAHLAKLGCTVPQSVQVEGPHNVISGQFQRVGQTDWAVLCHRGDTTSLFVFWEGSPEKSAEVGKGPDRDFLQGIGGEKIGFSHVISVTGKENILACYEGFGGPAPPAQLDHEGIDDRFYEKASIIWYWYEGKWHDLQGAD